MHIWVGFVEPFAAVPGGPAVETAVGTVLRRVFEIFRNIRSSFVYKFVYKSI